MVLELSPIKLVLLPHQHHVINGINVFCYVTCQHSLSINCQSVVRKSANVAAMVNYTKDGICYAASWIKV